MRTMRLLVIDSKMQSVEIEVNIHQFKMLGIDPQKSKEHKYKSELNTTVTRFLNSFKEEK